MTLLFEDVSVYNQEVINPNQVAMLADKADRIGLRYPVEVGLVGDAKPTAAVLSIFVERKEDRVHAIVSPPAP